MIHHKTLVAVVAAGAAMALCAARVHSQRSGAESPASADSRQGITQCANLIYGQNKSSVCFSDEFLAQAQKDTTICTNRRFCPVKLDDNELFGYPFAVMTGEGNFILTDAQRTNLRSYLKRGGFLVASAGCSSPTWDASFRAEMHIIFPELKLQKIDLSHPIFHTVYDIDALDNKRSAGTYIEALEIDKKIVMVYSKDGLNDTSAAGPGCCCCGGNEIYVARKVNVNLLAYALTH
ncbi:MAG: DUF4159 domain-containing protein [Planctomycetaceae bacterium]|nr:DUF4159 domain-containing protein [Planctomycetaceae bacterium]